MSEDKKIIVVFDGVCNLCVHSVMCIVKHDLDDNIRLVSMQSEIGKKIIKDYGIDINSNDSVISIDGKLIKYRSRAVFYILSYLRTSWRFLLIFSILPTFLTDFLYVIIAKNRYKFFGKREKCLMPSDTINSKFLS